MTRPPDFYDGFHIHIVALWFWHRAYVYTAAGVPTVAARHRAAARHLVSTRPADTDGDP